MNSIRMLKLFISISALTALAACAPKSSDQISFRNDETQIANIIGGTDVDLNYAKENGIVGVFDTELGGLCTGSLIADGLVVTAGHCANVDHPEKMVVFFGPNLDDIEAQAKQHDYSNIRRVTKVIRHEKYSVDGAAAPAPPKAAMKATLRSRSPIANRQPASIPAPAAVVPQATSPGVKTEKLAANDISLLHFDGAAVAGFKFATLASATQADLLKVGSLATLAGYGLSEFKQDPSTGETIVGKGAGVLRQVSGIQVIDLLPSLEEITFDQSQGHGACHGDSGGPAYLQDPQTHVSYLVGVTSRGGGNCDITAIYTGIIGYAQWIETNSKKLLP